MWGLGQCCKEVRWLDVKELNKSMGTDNEVKEEVADI